MKINIKIKNINKKYSERHQNQGKNTKIERYKVVKSNLLEIY